MEPVKWADVLPGDIVLGADRHEWEVVSIDRGVTMVREGREPVTGHPRPGATIPCRRGPEAAALVEAVRLFADAGMALTEVAPVEPQWLSGVAGGRKW